MALANPAPNPPPARPSFRSAVLWAATLTAAAAIWAYRKFIPRPQPLTRAEEKQRRKALARAARPSGR